MTTVADLGVNQENIRDYVLRNNKEALTQEQIDGVLYDYMEKVIRNPGFIPKWPKEVKDEMSSKGYIQDKTTGYPKYISGVSDSWASRCKVAEDEARSLRNQLDILSEKLLDEAD